MFEEQGRKLTEVGEKAFIRDFVKPFFNANDDPGGVGDDCAMVPFGEDLILLSTDRVPNDLTAFKLGIVDHFGLGDYLARLNLSDIAACGGKPLGLLLNLGLPSEMAYEEVLAICRGFGARAKRHGISVLGGDVTSAAELSISATAIGRIARARVLTRRSASAGDSIFISRPIGLTPAAFQVFLGKLEPRLNDDEIGQLRHQFTELEPMLALGERLSSSGYCSSCMDNTDGIGQSLTELSEASQCAFVVNGRALHVPAVVERVGKLSGILPLDFVFNGGADFSLVGTLRGGWTSETASSQFNHPLEVIGNVEAGNGPWLQDENRMPLRFSGWNYFAANCQQSSPDNST
jgi:thiamine-monophosphate kinase